MNGTKYDNIMQRAAAFYLETSAPKPEKAEQTAAYDFITGMYSAIISDPVKCGFKPQEDVYFTPWEQQKERQKDVKIIRDAQKKLKALMTEFYLLAVNAGVSGNALVLNENCSKISKSLALILTEAGAEVSKDRIELAEHCADGLKELVSVAQRAECPENVPAQSMAFIYFSRCVFAPEMPWTAMAFDKAMNADGQVMRLCSELEKRGYKRVDCNDGNKFSLDFVKLYGKKTQPLKMSWADKWHYGIELSYQDLRLEPYFIWVRMAEFKSVLEKSNAFPENAKAFILNSNKTCDGCSYCVQTDKTGTRPLAAVSVDGQMKCPYYPAFAMNWRHLTAEMTDNILTALDTAYSE